MREEEKKRTSQGSKFQQFFRKRWVFPAIYLLSATVILTAVLWYQAVRNDVSEQPMDSTDVSYHDEPSVEVNRSVENFKMPAIDPDAVQVVTKFYDFEASAEDQEAALVFYNNTYHPNQGIDIAREDGKPFEVVASLSGTVTKAEKDPILGHVIEIEHDDNLVTIYQSLSELKVKQGDKVEQGQVIGQAGKNQFNAEAGVHAHFEIRKDGKAYNPLNYMEKPMTSLTEQTAADGASDEENLMEENETTPSEENLTEEKETTPSEEKQPTNEENSNPNENEPEASLHSKNS
ncbi:peptidoglycan DD-metalloendopeptidase family protein [Bacillus alveayuensis]|jgi:stage II sporulation protein Q|uniref:peptidoglycan DD-metalloendopeptidase family protein n=1 Tax=Aeribacillus alveayuensis TaxID=279215 RepID=UPI0005CD0112|nr:M23 family metallopeptidase [Bacillus alveayuensis]